MACVKSSVISRGVLLLLALLIATASGRVIVEIIDEIENHDAAAVAPRLDDSFITSGTVPMILDTKKPVCASTGADCQNCCKCIYNSSKYLQGWDCSSCTAGTKRTRCEQYLSNGLCHCSAKLTSTPARVEVDVKIDQVPLVNGEVAELRGDVHTGDGDYNDQALISCEKWRDGPFPSKEDAVRTCVNSCVCMYRNREYLWSCSGRYQGACYASCRAERCP